MVLVIMGLLAVCAMGLTWATKNYIGASKAPARFHVSISGITCDQKNSEYVIGVCVNLKNKSEWDLSITSMRNIVYIDGQYVWGCNYDWLSNPFELPSGSEKDIVLEIEVPHTKTEVVARGGDDWSIRVSGLVVMPHLGSKSFSSKAVIPLERGIN